MKTILFTGLCALMMPLSAQAATISATPSRALQGDPVMITVSGTSTAGIRRATAAGTKLYFFTYAGEPTALYGISLDQQTGTTTVRAAFSDGSTATASFVIAPRPRPTEFLAIPAQLGGNSDASQMQLISDLKANNDILADIFSNTHIAFWTDDGASSFVFPVASSATSSVTVTDPYGYGRDSGIVTIPHKGVDFRAPPGTPVYAISGGVVRVATAYRVYGNSVIIDHGLGLLSMYMHLSKMSVSPRQSVQKGQLIGYSGETGYAEGPHLHLTIRIGGVSIDPIKFFALFGTTAYNP